MAIEALVLDAQHGAHEKLGEFGARGIGDFERADAAQGLAIGRFKKYRALARLRKSDVERQIAEHPEHRRRKDDGCNAGYNCDALGDPPETASSPARRFRLSVRVTTARACQALKRATHERGEIVTQGSEQLAPGSRGLAFCRPPGRRAVLGTLVVLHWRTWRHARSSTLTTVRASALKRLSSQRVASIGCAGAFGASYAGSASPIGTPLSHAAAGLGTNRGTKLPVSSQIRHAESRRVGPEAR